MKQLTPKQNTACASIFLNTLGLILEKKEEVDLSSHIKIFNKENIEVGILYFEDNKVKIIATKPNLKASYDMPEVFSLIDLEGERKALYGQWLSKISFDVENISGEFLVSSSVDSKYGMKCSCHASFDIKKEKEEVSFHVLKNGCILRIVRTKEDEIEKLEVRPSDGSNGFFVHDNIIGNYDNINNCYPYRKYCGIFDGPKTLEYKGKLHIFKKEEKNGKKLDVFNDFISEKDTSYQKRMMEKGYLMKELDPSFFERIKFFTSYTQVDDLLLLSRFVSVCLNTSSCELVESLLGMKKEDILFQNGSSNLEEAYYGLKEKEYMKNLLN